MTQTGRMVVLRGPRDVAMAAYDEESVSPGQVRLRTLYSGISAGTELTAYRGSNPYLTRHWDPERRLFDDGAASWEYPVTVWGYEEVGEVAEVGEGVTRVALGDVIWGTWGHRSSTVVDEAWAAERTLSPDTLAITGIFSRIGAIALNAVLDADIHVGETVAVFGQGVPGLIAAQLARLNGATVIAVDAVPKRLELARALGAHHVVDFTRARPPEAIKALTGGRGADVSIEISGAYPALHDAIAATAYNSRVVASGFFQGEGAGLRLGEEFHHNRIDIVCSQISGVSPRLDHRWDRARLERTVLDLQAQGRLDLEALVSHVMAVDEASEAFALVDEHPEDAIQVVLRF
jgi:2-desacetyl-2-hydroxyethyl bacteriochlorophyllide A dehydrogenase